MTPRCPTCKEWMWEWNAPHRCLPEFLVQMAEWHGEKLEDGSTVYAADAEDAAERFAREYNEDGDYALMNDTRVVRVAPASEPTAVQFFRIGAEPDICYSTEQIDADTYEAEKGR